MDVRSSDVPVAVQQHVMKRFSTFWYARSRFPNAPRWCLSQWSSAVHSCSGEPAEGDGAVTGAITPAWTRYPVNRRVTIASSRSMYTVPVLGQVLASELRVPASSASGPRLRVSASAQRRAVRY